MWLKYNLPSSFTIKLTDCVTTHMASQLSAFAPQAKFPLALHTHPSLFEKNNSVYLFLP